MEAHNIYSVVDVETTGLSPQRDRVTEVAIVRVQNAKITHSFATLVNPQRPIPSFIQQMTGISDAMVAKAPTFSEVLANVRNNLTGAIFVAHNVCFDHDFLKAEFARAEQVFPPLLLLDTVGMARKTMRGLPNYRLETLSEYLGLSSGGHRALSDATVTAHLLIKLLETNPIGHSMLTRPK